MGRQAQKEIDEGRNPFKTMDRSTQFRDPRTLGKKIKKGRIKNGIW